MPSLLARELETYEAHKADLLWNAMGRWVLIKGDRVLGTYDSQLEALRAGYQRLGHVLFLVKQVGGVKRPSQWIKRSA